jgi:hypothetical protein
MHSKTSGYEPQHSSVSLRTFAHSFLPTFNGFFSKAGADSEKRALHSRIGKEAVWSGAPSSPLEILKSIISGINSGQSEYDTLFLPNQILAYFPKPF